MPKFENSKQYDLEQRTQQFAINVRKFIRILPKDVSNIEDSKQLARSSGSVAANYIEANESFGKKDYYFRVKICRKEAKESKFWLTACNTNCNSVLEKQRKDLIQESIELTRIFGAIVEKGKSNQ